jgi:hypothetical protein
VRLSELARERFPDDELATEIAVREAFGAEESATYADDLDAQVEEQGVLKVVRIATHFQEELLEELREESSDGVIRDAARTMILSGGS